jgi:hypothetical protein
MVHMLKDVTTIVGIYEFGYLILLLDKKILDLINNGILLYGRHRLSQKKKKVF